MAPVPPPLPQVLAPMAYRRLLPLLLPLTFA